MYKKIVQSFKNQFEIYRTGIILLSLNNTTGTSNAISVEKTRLFFYMTKVTKVTLLKSEKGYT